MDKKIICAITGPTYAGKTTLSEKLISEYGFLFPKQTTTREKRLDDRKDYYRYISTGDFYDLKAQNAFILSSGAGNMSYGILKTDFNAILQNTDRLLLNISYEDMDQYNLLKYKKLLITLTYRNIKQGIENRIMNSNRKMSVSELQTRIRISQFLHDMYFEKVKENSDCIIYTDENDEMSTFEIVKKTLKNKME